MASPAPSPAPPPAETVDVAVIGSGHNGLVCAYYLARTGLRVGVYERREVVGGAAVTEEFHPGFRNSVASYTVSLLNPKVIRDMDLAGHGLRVVERPLGNFLPLGEAGYLLAGEGRTQAEVARFSAADAERLPAYTARLERAAGVLRDLLLETPPTPKRGLAGWGEAWRLLRQGAALRHLDTVAQRDLHALFTRSAGELLDDWFDSDPIKALLGFDAVVGNYASPYTPGSAYVQLHHVFGEVNGKPGVWGHAIGGMGAITQAMAKAARQAGATIATGDGVREVLTEGGRATGLVLASGKQVRARAVAANVNPKLLFGDLIDPAALDADFLLRMRSYRCGSATFRMNVALLELPDFTCRPSGGQAMEHHGAGIVIAPSLDYMDRAYLDARRDGWSANPVIEMLIPSTLDDSLAPAGCHVASLFCQHFAPTLPDGRNWDAERERVADHILATIDRFAPNFSRSVVGRQILSPLDLERTFGLIGGDIFHGALGLDQMFSARPVLGHGDYRMPLAGLYLCGSGAHPGGGVTGVPGHNAAREILRDWKR